MKLVGILLLVIGAIGVVLVVKDGIVINGIVTLVPDFSISYLSDNMKAAFGDCYQEKGRLFSVTMVPYQIIQTEVTENGLLFMITLSDLESVTEFAYMIQINRAMGRGQ